MSTLDISSIRVGNFAVGRSSVVRNLGSFIDDKLSMNTHINKLCNVSFYYMEFHNIWLINRDLSRDSTEALIHAFVTNRLDYCNGLSKQKKVSPKSCKHETILYANPGLT